MALFCNEISNLFVKCKGTFITLHLRHLYNLTVFFQELNTAVILKTILLNFHIIGTLKLLMLVNS
jgi:hypothetical protein